MSALGWLLTGAGAVVVLFVIWLLLWAADAWGPSCSGVNEAGVWCTDRPGHRADSCTFPGVDQ